MFEKLKNNVMTYEPYKYIMQDTGSLYIGAKSSYNELLENELLGFKMKAIIKQYILKEADPATTLESEMYYLTKESFSYEVYDQLKTKVKAQVLVSKKSLFGKEKTEYNEKTFSLEELINTNLAKKKGMGMVITEIVISKLSLMSFTV